MVSWKGKRGGAGGYGGVQVSVSNAQVPQDLAGPFFDFGAGGGSVLGVGGDLALGGGTKGQLVGQATLTGGGGGLIR